MRLLLLVVLLAPLAAGCPSPRPGPAAPVAEVPPIEGSAEPGEELPRKRPKVTVRRAEIERTGDPEVTITFPVFETTELKLAARLSAISSELRKMLESDAEAMEELARERDANDLGMPFNLSTSCAPTLVADFLVSIECSSSNYTGGAHGNYGTTTHNYLLESVDLRSLDVATFFATAELPALVDLVRSELARQGASEIVGGSVDDAELRALLESFAVTTEGVVFHFDPYAVASYAEGGFEVRLSHAEVARFLAAPFRASMQRIASGELGLDVVVDLPPSP
ncbi:MAG: DUF3298 domain-containing protein [Polyangiaceae bacterium]